MEAFLVLFEYFPTLLLCGARTNFHGDHEFINGTLWPRLWPGASGYQVGVSFFKPSS